MKIIPIAQWSPSKLKTFNECKFRFQLQYGQKIPEPERPLPPGKTEHANERGTRIHEAAEAYARGLGPFIPEMKKYQVEFDSLATLFSNGMAEFEGEWAHDKDWNPVPWKSKEAWLRLKIDALVHLSPYEAVVIDYKSGKKFGNEISHAEQTQAYQLVTLLRYPKIEIVHTELWYLDLDEITQTTFTRQQGMRFKPAIERKGHAITNAKEFPPNPNIFSCKFCPYSMRPATDRSPAGTGHCDKGVWK